MTDKEVEALIWAEIDKRDIRLCDMIGDRHVDPDPANTRQAASERVRPNRFKATDEAGRMQELLCRGEYHPLNGMPALKVSLQDLFRFWWNRCIVREYFVEDMLAEIYEYFVERMKPRRRARQMRLAVDFGKLAPDTLPN